MGCSGCAISPSIPRRTRAPCSSVKRISGQRQLGNSPLAMRIDGIGMANQRSPACRLTGSRGLVMAYADWLAFRELRGINAATICKALVVHGADIEHHQGYDDVRRTGNGDLRGDSLTDFSPPPLTAKRCVVVRRIPASLSLNAADCSKYSYCRVGPDERGHGQGHTDYQRPYARARTSKSARSIATPDEKVRLCQRQSHWCRSARLL